jgi:hypothetical protein
MALIVKQRPLFGYTGANGGMPVGQQIIFSVLDATTLSTYFNVEYNATIYVFDNAALNVATDSIGTFKTTPNNAGAGIWDFRPVLESFVSTDNIAPAHSNSTFSQYKTEDISNIPIHLIDKLSMNQDNMKKFQIKFTVSGSLTATAPVLLIDTEWAWEFNMFNGVLQYDNALMLSGESYGYRLNNAQAYPNTPVGLYGGGALAGQKLLSNAPTTQYANVDDYGTFACLSFLRTPANADGLGKVTIKVYNSSDALQGTLTLGQPYTMIQGWASQLQLIYMGVFPGNIRNHSSWFDGLITAGTIDGGYYTVQASNIPDTADSALYTIHLNCPTSLGYTPIRLAWINQWGTWDYYTFTKKSVKSIATKKAPYHQISGTWNEETLGISGYQGGRKNFRVNTSEKIKMNTPYVTEEEGHWFEELINSPEVYILNGYETESAPYDSITNKYVEPVTLTTSSFTRKTIANDKLMQYTIEVEKSKNRRTQSV